MRARCPSYKRSFLLLETLLAVAMVGLCSSWLIASPIKLYQRHLEDLKKIELSTYADHLFLRIQETLKERHPWKSLTAEESAVFPLETLLINIPPILDLSYACGYTLREKRSKEGLQHLHYKLIECTLYMTPSHPHFSWNAAALSKAYTCSYLLFVSATSKDNAL